MAVRGAEAKQKIISQIIENFPGAFTCNEGKELRIPIAENGERVEIKVALTCAKENIGDDDGEILDSDGNVTTSAPDARQQASLQKLLAKLGPLY